VVINICLKQRGLKFGGINVLSSQVTYIPQKKGKAFWTLSPMMSECSREALWVAKLLAAFNITCSSFIIRGNSQGELHAIVNATYTKHTQWSGEPCGYLHQALGRTYVHEVSEWAWHGGVAPTPAMRTS